MEGRWFLIDNRAVFNALGKILFLLAFTMLVPLLVAFYYREPLVPFIVSFFITLISALLLMYLNYPVWLEI